MKRLFPSRISFLFMVLLSRSNKIRSGFQSSMEIQKKVTACNWCMAYITAETLEKTSQLKLIKSKLEHRVHRFKFSVLNQYKEVITGMTIY